MSGQRPPVIALRERGAAFRSFSHGDCECAQALLVAFPHLNCGARRRTGRFGGRSRSRRGLRMGHAAAEAEAR
eukprot:1806454-Pleurochrysis_carterae.AAC.1